MFHSCSKSFHKMWNSTCIGAETWKLRKVYKKYSEQSDMW